MANLTKKAVIDKFFLDTNQTGNYQKHYGQLNRILKNGYTLEEVLYALDYYRGRMYSLGFLDNIRMQKATNQKKKLETVQAVKGEINYGELAERNRAKLKQNQCGGRREGYFDALF